MGTPIGNLSDLTLRALETLKQVDWIACEDTRQTLKLLNHYGIHKSLLSIFGPKEKREVPKILELLSASKSVALLTDAGTPGISDPGNLLVSEIRKCGFQVEPVPGVSAVSCAVSASGLCQEGFLFLGFLRRKKGKIKAELSKAGEQNLPIIFFESPFRIADTLDLALEVFGPKTFCWLGRELTKKFEEQISGRLPEVIGKIKDREILGEITVILKQQPNEKEADQ